MNSRTKKFYADLGLEPFFADLDGKLRESKREVWGSFGNIPSQLWEPAFCYCGKQGGYVTKGTPVIYVCLNCSELYGDLPLPKVPGTENL